MNLRNIIFNPANGIKDVEQQKLASQWLDKRQQAALLGHSSLDTARVYTTPGKSDLEKAVAALEG